jgi:hypothetical protein
MFVAQKQVISPGVHNVFPIACACTIYSSAANDLRLGKLSICSCLPKTTILPNGLEISYVSKEDAFFLYKEIFEDQGGYLKDGIALQAGNLGFHLF